MTPWYPKKSTWHLDVPLLSGLFFLLLAGLIVLYSASDGTWAMLERQGLRIILGLGVMFMLANLPPRAYKAWAYILFGGTILLLAAVLLMGATSKGAQRWLDIGLFRFQPSEVMKIALPLMLARFLTAGGLPLSFGRLVWGIFWIAVPVGLIAKQPDLGTAILVGASGVIMLFLAGLPVLWMATMGVGMALLGPVVWNHLHEYQKARIYTFFDPELDPLGTGYNIIQSKIALGSGGATGKGWLAGTQAHLDFLPECKTDFIFAVVGEEFGLLGTLVLISLYTWILVRSYLLALCAQDSFSRLLGGTIAFTFGVYCFVNIGMVSGVLPVVGVPLPLVSYGGTALLTLLAGFGILLSMSTHRQLVNR